MSEMQSFLDEVSTRLAERPEGDKVTLNLSEPGVVAMHELRIGSKMWNGEKPYISEIPGSVKPRLVGTFAVRGAAADEVSGSLYAVLDTEPPYVIPIDTPTANDVFGLAFGQPGEYVAVVGDSIEVVTEAHSATRDIMSEASSTVSDVFDINL